MTIRIARLGFVNAYLVEEDDGFTLVDTTMSGGAKAILAEVAKRDRPLKRIALTHGHGDHVGQVDAIVAAVPDVEVLLTARDARILAGDKSLDAGEAEEKITGSWPKIKTVPTTFEPGGTIGSLEIHASPGHTPGHVAFFDPRDGTLYCGDAFSTLGGVATTAKGTWKFPLPSMATWSKATALESAKTLRALNPKALAPGHGKVVENPGAAMDAAIARGL